MQKIGQTIQALLSDLKTAYAAESAYKVLDRIFADNFLLLESGHQAKQNKEIILGFLQSVDDLEANYRTKGTSHSKGYVAKTIQSDQHGNCICRHNQPATYSPLPGSQNEGGKGLQ